MSLAITVYVREGIVMAADSRLTLNQTVSQVDAQVVHLAVGQSDNVQKLFLSPNRVGISTFGDADIKGVPIAGFVDSFLATKLPDNGQVEETAKALLAFFRSNDPMPSTTFHVAGYTSSGAIAQQEVWLVDIRTNCCERKNPPEEQGATWGGEIDILSRLVNPVARVDASGKILMNLPDYPIPWGFFTLQDAIDFAIFATRSTIDAIRFQPRAKTVGGPIDVLVLQQNGCKWIQRKQLRGESKES
ncbi:MAG TPA: hypothetical protein VJR90_00630 [Gammaproteobacteria bacterium]|nr:hypothetical protein [Gammaproteobacteria bacterium]